MSVYAFPLQRRSAETAVLVAVMAACFLLSSAFAENSPRTEVRPQVQQYPDKDQPLVLVLNMEIPDGQYVYRGSDHSFDIQVEGKKNLGSPKMSYSSTQRINDPLSDGDEADTEVFKGDSRIRLTFPVTGGVGEKWEVKGRFRYRACTDKTCFLPQTKTFSFFGEIGKQQIEEQGEGESQTTAKSKSEKRLMTVQEGEIDAFQTLIKGFEVEARKAKYMGTSPFLKFLENARAGKAEPSMLDRLRRASPWLLPLLILVGGLGLNLTPCVLPMIPVNLAIIGAGTRAGSRRSGFALGAVYGLAMALAYGALGLVVVLTGSTFGNINASPMFNFVAGGIFVLLALALFGVFNIDFRRLAGKLQPSSTGRSIYGAALFMGALSAILAGACVAPVVIAVLVIAVQAYDAGHFFGLLLPFVLGVGMALPWPFAGAGLSFLPRPGNWMRGVERAFGVIVLVLAGYFIYTGWGLYQAERKSATAERRQENVKDEGLDWSESMVKRLNKARKENRMVFIDFWAPWCKACHLMERTTFRDEDVRKELEKFILVKYQVHRDPGPFEKRVLDHFDVYGLPLYVVLRPES